jgi:hypothetical protein
MTSIFDDSEVNRDGGDNAMRREATLISNSYREDLSIDIYARYLDIYRRVMNSYADFFCSNWYKDDVKKTNEAMIQELEEVGVSSGWTGLTEEENNPLGWYVITLDFPITSSQMREFFKRVMIGDLEFLCRYPIQETNAKNLIRENIDPTFYL